MKLIRGNLIIVALIAVLSLGFALTASASAAKDIEIGYVEWASAVATTNVVAAVLEDELGYDVQQTSVSAGIMWTGVANGELDAMVAAWLPGTHKHYLAETKDDIINLGPNLEGAKIGLVVPTYVTAESIADLNRYKDKFDGTIVGIDPGAGIMSATEKAMDAYDLDLELMDGSGAAMTAQLKRSYRNKDWIVVTGWVPHWKFAKFDLKFLTDPKGVYGGAETINTIARQGLEEDAPDAYRFLDNFHWTPGEIGAVMALIQDGMKPEKAAHQWIGEHPDRVAEWLD